MSDYSASYPEDRSGWLQLAMDLPEGTSRSPDFYAPVVGRYNPLNVPGYVNAMITGMHGGYSPEDEFVLRIRDLGEKSEPIGPHGETTDRSKSPAGALGRMQVMPKTAKNPGYGIRGATEPFSENELARVGTEYAKAMLKEYDNNWVLASAAYNAGPGNVDAWIKRFGDPRKGEISERAWLDKIPSAETRAYVPRVVGGSLAAPGQSDQVARLVSGEATASAPPMPGGVPEGLPGSLETGEPVTRVAPLPLPALSVSNSLIPKSPAELLGLKFGLPGLENLDLSKLMALAMIQKMVPSGMGLERVDHDPFKVAEAIGKTAVPRFTATRIAAPKVALAAGELGRVEAPGGVTMTPGQGISLADLLAGIGGSGAVGTGRSRPSGAGRRRQYEGSGSE